MLVVEHEQGTDAHLLGRWLEHEGCALVVVRPYRGDALPADPGAYDAVVVLGGTMDSWDDAGHPWLPATRELVRRAAQEAYTPVLGVCMGHQLAATALGGRVGRNPAGRTRTVVGVDWSADVADDPLLGRVTADVAVHFNTDVVLDLPPGAQVLAATGDGAPQVVRFAPTVWGVQCHPEADAELVTRWVRDPHDAVVRATQERTEDLARGWRPLAAALAGLAREGVPS